ncbi:NACHT domain-containing protein [Nocardia sp. NPDC051750]|uniref:NACHT domain-containing protein n=1 Tax=Nocardia sp. NPDC051750 TaxID=3364325 RepID=UPI003799908D
MNYDLTRLGSNRFEHMVQALALGHIGPGVDVFGAGPDGGREATFRGKIHLEGKGEWDGYGVIQAKYKERLSATAADQAWFFDQVTAELDAWINPKKKRSLRKPEYFIIVTNVTLTSVAEAGGLDRLERLFAYYRDLTKEEPLGSGNFRMIGMPDFKDYAVWHADYLYRLLDNNGEVRRSYADLVLTGDVISRLYEQVSASDERVAHAWIGHVTRALKADASVELGESGDRANSPLALAEVAVDLPSSGVRNRATALALQSLVERGDQVLSPSLKPSARDRIVVLGGPGSGKSTLSRLLCQLYRIALVQEEAAGRVALHDADRATQIRKSFDAANLPHPSLHRLPVRVVLSIFADAISRSKDLTLLKHIVELINSRGSEPISVPEVKRLLSAWPLLLVLDGMDEVASATNREEVSARIAEFLTEMAMIRADVMTVCTSRPIGFEHDPDISYEELHLTPLKPRDALNYASRLLASRFIDDPDRQETTLQRLEAASKNEDTARLMTSPLQVTILSLLLEQRRQAPASRYSLFKSYYDVIYARESNKPDGIGDVLEAYRQQFDQLHERCGLVIHARAERAGTADSILPTEDLELIAREILGSEGYRESDLKPLIQKIMHLARQRLVLLVPRMDGLSFELRSLTEFFAARCLMGGEDAADNLEILVPSVHWRHTWLLAAGYIFSERLQLRDAVLSRLVAVDHSNAASRLVMPGAVLAMDALQDGFAANTPRFQQELVLASLRLLTGPIGAHITRLAEILAPHMERDGEIRAKVWLEVEALLSDNSSGATRAFLDGLGASGSESIANRAIHMLADFSEKGKIPTNTSTAVTVDSVIAELREKLGELLPPSPADLDDQALFEVFLDWSLDGSERDGGVKVIREGLVELCRDDFTLRSKVRAALAKSIAFDEIGYSLPNVAGYLTPEPF